MSKCVVVTESQIDVLLLQAILDLSPNDPQVSFEAAGGTSSADSYARTVLIMDEADVALVVDADSRDPNAVEERRRFLNRSLREVALRKEFRVFVIEPEIQGLLFENRTIVEQLCGKPVSDTDLVAAYYSPRQVLATLLPKNKLLEAFETRLPGIDLSPLRADPVIRDILKFLPRSEHNMATTAQRL